MEQIEKLAQSGKTNLIGQLESKEGYPIKGEVVYNVTSAAEAGSLANPNPAVKTGRLMVEIIPFWFGKGSCFKSKKIYLSII